MSSFMRYPTVALSLLSSLYGVGSALPLEAQKRDVSAAVFDELSFFSQYSAAAYCLENNNSPNTKVTCPQGNCALVEAADTNTVSEFENTLATDATGFVATDTTNELIVLSFRGSRSVRNWIANVNFGLTDVSFCSGCKAHAGFKASWDDARSVVLAALATAIEQYPTYKIIATGHSLGGSMASLAAGDLRSQGKKVDLYTYGAPRTGNAALSTYLGSTSNGTSFRTVHKNDTVPTLPPIVPALLPYANIYPEYYVTSPNEVMPTTADVTVITSGDDGNPGTDTDAHLWYFGPITECDGQSGIEIKE